MSDSHSENTGSNPVGAAEIFLKESEAPLQTLCLDFY